MSSSSGPLSNLGYGHFMEDITPLLDDENYDYEVECAITIMAGKFHTPPASVTGQRTKMLAYGDTRSAPAVHDTVACQMINNNPDYKTIALHVGDWVNDGQCMRSWNDEFFDPAYRNIRRLLADVPIDGCRGNHEMYGNWKCDGDGTPFETLWDYAFPYSFADFPDGPLGSPDALSYSLNYGSIHVAVLDQYKGTSYNSAYATNGTADYKWLDNDLSSTTADWKVVVMHQPMYSAEPGVNEPDLEDLLVKKGVHVIAGHDHYYARNLVRGINHIVTGGGGAPLYAPDHSQAIKSAAIHHYCRIEAAEDCLCFEAIVGQSRFENGISYTEGEIFDHFAIKRDGSNCTESQQEADLGYTCGNQTRSVRATDEECASTSSTCDSPEVQCSDGTCGLPKGASCESDDDCCIGCHPKKGTCK